MSNRLLAVLCAVIIGGFVAFGVAKSKPPWDLPSIIKRFTGPAPRMEWPSQEPARAPMQPETTYVCNYSRILNYTVAPDAVYASVRAGFKSALLAWTKDGNLLWDRTLYDGSGKTQTNYLQFGIPMAVADSQLVVSSTDARPNGAMKLLWLDRKTGRTTGELPVFPSALAYYPKVRLIIALVGMPDTLLANGRQLGRMDVVAYSLNRHEVWRRRLPTPDTQPLRFDGNVLVLTNTPPYYPHERAPGRGAVYVKRLDPATGEDVWSTSPQIAAGAQQPATTATGTITLNDTPAIKNEAVSIYFRGHVFVYSVGTGQELWRWKIPADLLGLPVSLQGDSKHLYLARDAPQAGPSPAAIEYPTGKFAWSDSSIQAYYTPPVIWNDKAVYMVWPANAPTLGLLPFVRLYIRSPQGTFLCTEKEINLRSNFAPQVHDDLLYTINGYNIVAYRWLGK